MRKKWKHTDEHRVSLSRERGRSATLDEGCRQLAPTFGTADRWFYILYFEILNQNISSLKIYNLFSKRITVQFNLLLKSKWKTWTSRWLFLHLLKIWRPESPDSQAVMDRTFSGEVWFTVSCCSPQNCNRHLSFKTKSVFCCQGNEMLKESIHKLH